MCEKENLNTNDPQERPIHDKQPEINIEKGKINEGLNNESPKPDAWEPTRDRTGSNPPGGGSGVGNDEND